MDLIVKNIDTQQELEKVEYLMTSSFPAYEQTSIDELCQMAKNKSSKFLGYYLNNTFIGFTFTHKLNDMVFLYYLVIDKNYQCQGIGSKILNLLLQNKVQLFLNIEPVDKNAKNSIEYKRLKFYEKNGLFLTDYSLNYENELYNIVSTNKKIDTFEYKKLLVDFSNNFIDCSFVENQ